ncbi:MAG: UvrD-helicase domain-containing protein [Treponema sp.]|nr:UvrD-helicase domain-containing protein [Treponema sp.]
MDIQQGLSVLNEEQYAAVVHEGSPLLILAGAGSGKTRVITTKIAYLINQKNVEPYSILSVTFTKKAANEMRQRAVAMEERAQSSVIRTFHSFGSWFLRKFSQEVGLIPSFTVYDDSDMEVLLKKAVPSLSSKEAKLAAHQISLAKDYFLTPEDDLTLLGSEFDINQIYFEYEKRLRATGNVDFGDLIMKPAQIMEQYQDIENYIHNRFKVVMVDEYQDSNIAQYKLLQKISGVERNTGNYVCVVGDDDQSIYKFRGAEVQNILSFSEKFPGTEIVKLQTNYRSTSKILDAASIVVQKNKNRLGKTLVSDRGEGEKPTLAFLGDANEEATYVADLIKNSLKNDGNYSDWAILYRTNAQSLTFEKEFLKRKIPYVLVGSLKFYEREEIKDVLAYISLLANPQDEISFRRIVNKPTRGIGPKTQDAIVENAFDGNQYKNLLEFSKEYSENLTKKAKEGVESFLSIMNSISESLKTEKNLAEFIQKVSVITGLEEYYKSSDEIEGTSRVENLQELANSAVPFECNIEGLTDFLDSINLDRSLELSEGEVSNDAVTLITLHNTKGLEYNKVVITGLEDGIFPRMGKVGDELEEERRLFYVGITRAKDELYITSVAKRLMYGSWQYMKPSQFLSDAEDAFSVIGRVPYGFASYSKPATKKQNFGTFGKQITSSTFASRGATFTSQDFSKEEDYQTALDYQTGTKVFVDDEGYGIITKQFVKNEEIVVDVQFENGKVKKYLPKYQKNKLLVIKD